MKHLATIFFIVISSFVKGQDATTLRQVPTPGLTKEGFAIIYGNFIQRLGFSSGGFPQDISLMNVDTKEIVIFRVKPTFKSTRENTFIYFIKPGNYAILNYWWTQSKAYGGTMFTEPIYINVDASNNFEKRVRSGEIKQDQLKQFQFAISVNSLNYIGTWHFDSGLVSFTNEKEQLDDSIKKKYKRLDFSFATTVLPQ